MPTMSASRGVVISAHSSNSGSTLRWRADRGFAPYVFSGPLLSPVHGASPAEALAKAGIGQAF